MKKKDNRPATEFRKSHAKGLQGHPTYIYAKVGREYKFIGLTHAEITDRMTNIPLDCNPDPQDSAPAFLRPTVDKAERSSFGRAEKGWKFTPEDKKKADEVIKTTDPQKKRP